MHRVKCSICGQVFDRDKEDFVATSSRRYAHRKCYEVPEESDSKSAEILQYLKDLFGLNYSRVRIENQLNKLMAENSEYTYSGVLSTLKYWYEIRNGDISKSGYGIGIVPYIYWEAYNYYYNLWKVQQLNQDKNFDDYKPKDIIVKISNPQLHPRYRNRFSFLDE